MWAAGLSMAAIAMSITGSGVALAQVQLGEPIGIAHLQWVMNAFILSFAALLLPFGSLADRIGERPVFLLGTVVFGLATLVSVSADSFAVLIAGRLLQGVGGALLTAAGPPALTSAFQEESAQKRAFGYLGASGGVGLTLGGFLAGVASSSGDWRLAFALHLPFVVAASVIAWRGFHGKSATRTARFDWKGALWCSLAITAAMTFGINGGSQGWSAPGVVMALIVALVAGAAFVHVERQHPAPLLRLSTFHNRQFLLACAICVLFTTVWVALFIYVPLNLRTVQSRSGVDAGATLLALMIPALVMPMIATRCAQSVSVDAVVISGFLLLCIGMLLLAHAWNGELRREFELAGLIVSGSGAGALYGLVDYLALTAVPPGQSGAASGAFNVVRLVGDALGSIVPGAALLHTLNRDLSAAADLDLSRMTLNELAAGRFGALGEMGTDPTSLDTLIGHARASFSAGMTLALQILCALSALGIIAVVIALLRSPRRRVHEGKLECDVGPARGD